MIIFLACLFVVAVAIGTYVAFAVAEALLRGGADRTIVAPSSPHV
jgi:hypothetical protein